jgi:hypothetical protein
MAQVEANHTDLAMPANEPHHPDSAATVTVVALLTCPDATSWTERTPIAPLEVAAEVHHRDEKMTAFRIDETMIECLCEEMTIASYHDVTISDDDHLHRHDTGTTVCQEGETATEAAHDPHYREEKISRGMTCSEETL